MELYKKYLEERDGATVYYNEFGFVTYSIVNGGECYISELYVVPEKRCTKVAWLLYLHVLRVAALAKCTHLLGSVDTSTKNWKLSEKLMLKQGFVEREKNQNMKFFVKNL